MMKIYEGKNHLLICADSIAPEKHSHMAAHMIISLREPIGVTIHNDFHVCTGAVIPSGHDHAVDSKGNKLLVFLYDCTTTVARHFQEPFIIDSVLCEKIVKDYSMFEQMDPYEYYAWFEKRVLQHMGIVESCSIVRDARIRFAMDYIRGRITEKISCKEVATAISLSESRFSHLFRKELGMTFAAYLVYQRLMYVYARIFVGISMTEAALEAGFSSSSHFSDVNRRVFGLSASAIMRDMKFINVK